MDLIRHAASVYPFISPNHEDVSFWDAEWSVRVRVEILSHTHTLLKFDYFLFK